MFALLADELISIIFCFLDKENYINLLLTSKLSHEIGIKNESLNKIVKNSKTTFELIEKSQNLEIENLEKLQFNIDILLIKNKTKKIFNQKILSNDKIDNFFDHIIFKKISLEKDDPDKQETINKLKFVVNNNVYDFKFENSQFYHYLFEIKKNNKLATICTNSFDDTQIQQNKNNQSIEDLLNITEECSNDQIFVIFLLILSNFNKKRLKEILFIDFDKNYYQSLNLNEKNIKITFKSLNFGKK